MVWTLAAKGLLGWDMLSIQPNVTHFMSSDLEPEATGGERL